jgi:glyoxylase I family protein
MELSRVHHVSLNVDDVDAAVSFYTEVLGCGLREDRPDFPFAGAWLDVGPQQIHLIAADVPPDRGQHVSLQVDDIRAAVAELRARGVEVSDPRPVGAVVQCFLHDPSGNRIELDEVVTS